MNDGMNGMGLFGFLIVVLLIALVVLAIAGTVWLVRNMTDRTGGGGRPSDPASTTAP
jgi:zona occludens toxin (predicted ATPase)